MNVNNISKNLKYLRKKNGLTQASIRSRLGFTRSTWSNYETGVTNPSIDDLINFSRFFGVTLDELILRDLEANDPQPQKSIKKKTTGKPVVYATNDIITTTAEPDITYVLKEIEKLREEVKNLRNRKQKK
jgi:transcriptional regulator with XRE-family HTH domain